MKVQANRHVGIIVRNLDKMVDFYVGLGFTLTRRDMESGEFLDGLLNSNGLELETAKLRVVKPGEAVHDAFCLELMSQRGGGDSDAGGQSPDREGFDFRKRKPGILDLAFTVDDINAVSEYITSRGGGILGGVMVTKTGFPASHLYCADPEGNILHLAQNL